ncbi:MAG: FtsX-like permease family protein [Candidatus Thorarchaeota archaeon]
MDAVIVALLNILISTLCNNIRRRLGFGPYISLENDSQRGFTLTHTGLTHLKGSPWWSFSYAVVSLKNYPLRNIGIALILSMGVALPTTVFIWTSTGTVIGVENFFDKYPIQMALEPRYGETWLSADMEGARAFSDAHRFIDTTYTVPTTIGILVGDFFPEWSYYHWLANNYAQGVKDARTLLVTNELLETIDGSFDYEGNFTLQPGQILVSNEWVDYAYEVHSLRFGVGSVVGIDVLTIGNQDSGGTPESLGSLPLRNVTIAGVYRYKSRSHIFPETFPSISRKNWDPMSPYSEVILGIRDSVLILREDIGDANATIIENRGFFEPGVLISADRDVLFATGPENIADNLINFRNQLEEKYPDVFVNGLTELWSLDTLITVYTRSQALTIVVLPVLVMSMVLTVFTSETSISRRKGEISALRSKGASFNQIISAFMWESIFLSVIGLLLGLGLAILMAPFAGASTGVFEVDPVVFVDYFNHTSIPPAAIIIACAISLYLPAAYLLHVSRRIDVGEIGQPSTEIPDEIATDPRLKRNIGLFGVLLVGIVSIPSLVPPVQWIATVEIMLVTILLFVASYFGSRLMQEFTSQFSKGARFFLGQRYLYLSSSLKRRRRQFIPLMAILTLTLTASTMMIIQGSSFETTLDTELTYAIGGGMRVECNNRLFTFNDTITTYDGIGKITPVFRYPAFAAKSRFFVMAVDPSTYLSLGTFTSESFVSGSPQTILTQLETTRNGIIISDYFSHLWNKRVGDNLTINVGGRVMHFVIVGTMKSAPGFGAASSTDLTDRTLGSMFDFQVTGEGFVLVNLDYMIERTGKRRTDLFLCETFPCVDKTESIRKISRYHEVWVHTPDTFKAERKSYSLGLFISGFHGLVLIGFIMCTVMALAALSLFLGSAVNERKSEYALFRALGGTKRQVLTMVFGEFSGSVVTAILASIILGLTFGYTLSLLSVGLAPFHPLLSGILSYPSVLLSTILVLEFGIMLISCYFPARRASYTDPATTLRNL